MKKIAFFDTKPYDRTYFDKYGKNYEITYFEEKLNHHTAKITEGFDGVCAFVNSNINKMAIERMHERGVQILAMRCAGFSNVDIAAAAGKLAVVRVPAYSPHAVAEHALALLLALNRRIYRAYIRTRDFNFNINGLTGIDLYGKTAGIIGTIQAAEAIRYLLGIPSLLTGKLLVLDGLRMQFRTVPFPHVSEHCPLHTRKGVTDL